MAAEGVRLDQLRFLDIRESFGLHVRRQFPRFQESACARGNRAETGAAARVPEVGTDAPPRFDFNHDFSAILRFTRAARG
jgi:hypothetical protein